MRSLWQSLVPKPATAVAVGRSWRTPRALAYANGAYAIRRRPSAVANGIGRRPSAVANGIGRRPSAVANGIGRRPPAPADAKPIRGDDAAVRVGQVSELSSLRVWV